MLIEPQSRRRSCKDMRQHRLMHRKGHMPQVVPVKLDQIKGVQKHACIMVPIPNAIEICDPVLATSDHLPVNDARL
jgi:hypothetical protein